MNHVSEPSVALGLAGPDSGRRFYQPLTSNLVLIPNAPCLFQVLNLGGQALMAICKEEVAPIVMPVGGPLAVPRPAVGGIQVRIETDPGWIGLGPDITQHDHFRWPEHSGVPLSRTGPWYQPPSMSPKRRS